MDVGTLCGILESTLHREEEIRRNAESQLRSLEDKEGYVQVLLSIASDPTVGIAVNQAAALCLKNFALAGWHSNRICDEDKNALYTQIISTLAGIQEPIVARPLVVLLDPMMQEYALCADLVDSIIQQLHHFWGQGDAVRVVTFVRALKVAFKTSLRLAISDPQGARVYSVLAPRLLDAFQTVFSLLKMCSEARFFQIRKLLAGILRLGVHACALDNLVKDTELLQSWLSHLLEVLREQVPDCSEDDQMHIWKAKTRLIDTWQALLVDFRFSHTPEMEAVSVCMQESMGPIVETFLSFITTPTPDPSSWNSDLNVAHGKCLTASLECIAHEVCTDKPAMHAFIAPRAWSLLTEMLFPLCGLQPGDDELLSDDPDEYANRSAEEIKGALLSSPSADDEEEEDTEESAGFTPVSTPRAAAMRAVRQILANCDDSVKAAFLEWLQRIFTTDAVLDGTQNAQQIFSVTSTRIAAMRCVGAVSDVMDTEGDKCQDLFTFILTRLVLPEAITQASPLSEHSRSIAVTIFGRNIPYLLLCGRPGEMQECFQHVISSMCDPSPCVRIHGLHAFKRVLWEKDLQELREDFIPDIFNWFLGLLTQDLMAEQLVDAISVCLYACPGLMGKPSATDPRHSDEELSRVSILETHLTVLQQFTRRYFVIRESLSDAQNEGSLHAIEKELCRFIGAIHALTNSFTHGGESDGPYDDAYMSALMPYLQDVLQPTVFAIAFRHACDVEVIDVLPYVSKKDPTSTMPFLSTLLNTVHHLPNLADLFSAMICDMIHKCGEHVVVEEGESALAKAIMSTAVRSSSSGNHISQCWALDMIRSAIVCTATNETGQVGSFHSRSLYGPPITDAMRVARAPFITYALEQLITSWAALSQSAVITELPIRILSCISAALYIDPQAVVACIQQLQQDPFNVITAYVSLMAKCFESIAYPRRVDMRLCCFGLESVLSLIPLIPPIWNITATCTTMAVILLQRITDSEMEGANLPVLSMEEMTAWLDPECDMQAELDEMMDESELSLFSETIDSLDQELFAQVRVQMGPQVEEVMRVLSTY